VGGVAISHRHPGLQLDKFIRPARRQEQQKQSLAEVCQATGDGTLLKTLLRRREAYLDGVAAAQWRCITTAPLTLHLARASALENAGICLHPLYGFVYLPGTGLKGMARGYAETVWLPTQYRADASGQPADDAERGKATTAWQMIEAVFGWAPHSDDGKDKWKPAGLPRHETDDSAASGSIVFHEAWPETWPRLELDIVNNHHVKYYQGSDSQDAPGDWESPVMVSFLAVGPGHTFCFALSKRRANIADDLLKIAQQWLLAALVHEGAGAKTAAGYGGFKPCEGASPALPKSSREVFTTTLELITPAFLAGANQEAGDCQLRTATLRGLLRWWWRTMHAGFVDVATLRRLETVVWGDVNTGGAVRVTVEPQTSVHPVLYDCKERFAPKRDFQRQYQLQPPPQKTAQGLFYASYGMNDGRNMRHYLEPGTQWTIRLMARKSYCGMRDARGKPVCSSIPPALILQEAKAALWLLTHFGGVGSKSRKGFGCFADIAADAVGTVELCQQAAAVFRRVCGCDGPFQERLADSLALAQMLPPLEIPTGWKDHWFALDQLGYAIQSFAQKHKHDPGKAALGLPRQIHGPRPSPLGGQDRSSHRPPKRLTGPKGDRFAAPIFYHLTRGANDALLVRVAALPTKHLPDLPASTAMLTELLEHLRGDLQQRARQPGPEGPAVPATRAGHPAGRKAAQPAIPKAGDLIEATLVEDPKGKGRLFARHDPSRLVGPILNADQVPADKHAGDTLALLVASISSDAKQIQFRIPADEDRQRTARPRGGPPHGPSRRR
jgi:CRISPR-associated protein Cmr6